ncbi:DUF2059 domain-containing protein [Kingella denitrificans]|jgi:hypothetical protein
MKRKICSCVAALALLAAAPAWAEPASAESVQKMMRVMKMESEFDNSISSMLQMMRDQMVNSIPKHANISTEQRVQIETVMRNAWQKYQERLTSDAELRASVFARFQQLVQKHYTQQEVDALIGFYDSPLGQSILDKQGVMLGEFMQSVPAIVDVKLQSMARETAREMEAEIRRIVNQGRGRRGK